MMISRLLVQRIPNRLKPPLLILLGYLRLLIRLMKGSLVKHFRIKLSQRRIIRENYSPNTERLIVFLSMGKDIVNGGILSISSIYEETTKLKHIHGAEVIMCIIPGDPLLLRYTKFSNQNYIYSLPQVISYFRNLQHLMIHIPEYCTHRFLQYTPKREYAALWKVNDVHINILLQNMNLLPSKSTIEKLRELGVLICTTAHQQYTTPELRVELGIPLHKLSAWVSPEQYHRREHGQKEELMIVSPDAHPRKSEVLSLISRRFPQLRIQIIRNLTYEKYREVISQAKWALTFGEGLDGYYLETIFSGGVSFAVYNSKFFTKDFKSLRTVYDSYDILLKQICSDMKALDNEVAYASCQDEQYKLCCKYYDFEQYVKNLELFYKGEYTYA